MLEETLSTAAEDYGIDWSVETDVAHECFMGYGGQDLLMSPMLKRLPTSALSCSSAAAKIRKTAPGEFCRSCGSS